MEEQKLNIYLQNLRLKGEVEQGFLNVFLNYEKYLIDKFDIERCITITLLILEHKLNIYLIF